MSSIENKRIALSRYLRSFYDRASILGKAWVGTGGRIVISIGINDKKLTYFSLEKRMEAIWNLYKDNQKGESHVI